MGTCRMERTIANMSEALHRAKEGTRARGGTFEGDGTAGHFVMKTPLGVVAGSYSVTGTSVLFLVERKPTLVPCALIEQVLDQFLVA